jgi:16S rRNA (cytosine967-C5)-methyltransferase
MDERPKGRPGRQPDRRRHTGSVHGNRNEGPGRRPPRGDQRPDAGTTRPQKDPAGYPARALAVRLISAVLDRKRALDDALSAELSAGPGAALEARDRAMARLIAVTTLRRKGELDRVVANFIERPLPADRGLLSHILVSAAAQLLVLDMPPHAVLNIAVEQCRRDRGARRFDKLANAVLRRVSELGREILSGAGGPRLDVADWQWTRWTAAYGVETATEIAAASLREAPLDLTPKNPAEASQWAERLGGMLLPTGTIRIPDPATRVDALPGFAEGAWWVQDAAAALPARLLGVVSGLAVADICAAPGGKTAQLAAAGARVTAVDASAERLKRLRQNLSRLEMSAEVVTADVIEWQPDRLFDAVLLDAPCTATGTIRRHPDILYLKRPTDLAPLVDLQARMLDHAAALVAVGGTMVYCTCSLEPEEGEQQIARFLERNQDFSRRALRPGEVGLEPGWLTPAGDLRTLPFHAPGNGAPPGMDGFYAARLLRLA